MSEKIRTGAEQRPEQLWAAEHFRVDPDDYPIFRQQAERKPTWGDNEEIVWNIDKTASQYVTETADLISILDGTAVKDPFSGEPYGTKPDHVIYLDKSARPVSWLVNAFWRDFSEESRPENSFLNIDRKPWFQRVLPDYNFGTELYTDNSGVKRRPDFADFMKYADTIPPEKFAQLRALYIEGGVETDDPAEIMKIPTKLDGKNVMVIDEVADTGSTLKIAQYLLKRAIPEIGEIRGEYFWHQTPKKNHDGTQTQQTSAPVWYKDEDIRGRGIGEINPVFFDQRHEKFQTPRTRAQKLGSFVLGEYVNLDEEPGGRSRELAREIVQMREDYEAGKILLRTPLHWDLDREDAYREVLQKAGVRFVLPDEASPADLRDPNNYTNVVQEIDSRPATYY